MANILYFIGAGASKSATKAVPLMNDFFQKCGDFLNVDEPAVFWPFVMLYFYRIFEGRDAELENLAAQIRITNGQDQRKMLGQFIEKIKKNLNHPERLENLAVFSRAEGYWQTTGEDQSYTRLLQLINCILIRLYKQNPKSLAYEELAEMIKQHIDNNQHTLVSFNYDLWLENSLFRSGIWNPAWGFVDGPLITTEYFMASDVKQDSLEKSRRIDSRSLGITSKNKNILVLKPHGCLCWYTRLVYDSELLLVLKDDGNVGFYEGYNVSYAPLQELLEQNRKADVLYPLLVPPTPAKRKSHPILLRTDVHFRQRLLTADIVVIIGWSMPETDEEDKKLIEHVMQRRKTQIKKLIICDKREDATHYSRFEQLFRPKECFEWKEGFSEKFVQYLTQILTVESSRL